MKIEDEVDAAGFCFGAMILMAVVGYVGWIIGGVL